MDRLIEERDFWLGTSGLDGAPHSSPVWLVEVGGVLYFFSERTTIKARNLKLNPLVVLHPPGASLVTIVHGAVVDLGQPTDHPDVLSAFVTKYDMPGDIDFLPLDPAADQYVLYRVEPDRAFAWDLADYEASQQRWYREATEPA